MNWKLPKVYAVKHLDNRVITASRSGGIFTALSDEFINNDGVVYGCVLTDSFEAIHIRTKDKVGRDNMRGSKYIQSKLGNTFKTVKSDLDTGYSVLFSGTSCQIAGLKKFLEKEYEQLFCVDIVCHGVPSVKVWKKYLEWQQKNAKAKVISVNFRNKVDYGWHSHVETLCMDNGAKVSSRVFTSLFYGHHILRPSCYECPFKSIMHPGDITIADYWGIEKAAPEFNDDKGVSLVLVNNEKGAQLLENIKAMIRWKETKIENSMQEPLKAPFQKPADRDKFWNDFRTHEFAYVARKYGEFGLLNCGKKILRKIYEKFLYRKR